MLTISLNDEILRQNREFIKSFASHRYQCPPGSVELLQAITAKVRDDWDSINSERTLLISAASAQQTLIDVISRATAAAELANDFSIFVYSAENNNELTDYQHEAVNAFDQLTDLLQSIGKALIRNNQSARGATFEANIKRYSLALHVANLLTHLQDRLYRKASALRLAAEVKSRLAETLAAQAHYDDQASAHLMEQSAARNGA